MPQMPPQKMPPGVANAPIIEAAQPISEVTWLMTITQIDPPKQTADGTIILAYTLKNGHKFVIPLNGKALEVTRQVLAVPAAASPNNGSGD